MDSKTIGLEQNLFYLLGVAIFLQFSRDVSLLRLHYFLRLLICQCLYNIIYHCNGFFFPRSELGWI